MRLSARCRRQPIFVCRSFTAPAAGNLPLNTATDSAFLTSLRLIYILVRCDAQGTELPISTRQTLYDL